MGELDDSAQNIFGPLGRIVCFCNHRSSAYLRSPEPNKPYLQWVPAGYMDRIICPVCDVKSDFGDV